MKKTLPIALILMTISVHASDCVVKFQNIVVTDRYDDDLKKSNRIDPSLKQLIESKGYEFYNEGSPRPNKVLPLAVSFRKTYDFRSVSEVPMMQHQNSTTIDHIKRRYYLNKYWIKEAIAPLNKRIEFGYTFGDLNGGFKLKDGYGLSQNDKEDAYEKMAEAIPECR